MSRKLEGRIVDRLDEAISEAERFLARAKLAQKALKAGDGTAYRCYEFAAAKMGISGPGDGSGEPTKGHERMTRESEVA